MRIAVISDIHGNLVALIEDRLCYSSGLDQFQQLGWCTMNRFVSNLTSNGRVTIPAGLRRQLGLSAGDKLQFVVNDDGVVRVKKLENSAIASIARLSGTLDEPVSWEDIEEIVGDERAERFREKFLRGE